MKDPIYDNYRELIELIPLIQEAAIKGLRRDRINFVYDKDRIGRKAKWTRNLFSIIQGKWTIEVYYTIVMYSKIGFNKIKKVLQGISSRTLSDRLQFLEEKGLIIRKVRNKRPLRVHYILSDFGKASTALLVPFMVYLNLPLKIKKGFPEIHEIDKNARIAIAEEQKDNL